MKRIAFIIMAVVSIAAVSCKTSKVLPTPAQPSELQQLQEQIAAKDKEITSLKQDVEKYKAKLVVYEFFNEEGISIFTNKSLEINGEDKKLEGKAKTKYETIRMIADVENRLTEIDNKIQQLQKQQQSKKWSASELRNAVRLDIKADMETIANQLDAIDKRDLSDFSAIQLDYYRKQSERYDNFEKKYL